VATDVTGIPEVVRDGDTGLLCQSGSVDDLVHAIQRIARPDFDTRGVTRRARQLIEDLFDSTLQARRLHGLRSDTVPTIADSTDDRKVA
jgi:glycosyltransferase involved in cell wall biosynthesis